MARAWRIAIGGVVVASACADLGGLQSGGGEVDAGAEAAPPPPPPPPPPPADAADAGGYGAVVLADAPIAYWPLDEPVGSSVAHDAVGMHDGSAVGKVTFGAGGVSGTALHIDAAGGGWLDVGDAFDFVGTSPFSVEVWATPILDGGFENIAEKRVFDGGAGDGWVLYFAGLGDGAAAEVQFEQPGFLPRQRVAWETIDVAAAPHHVVVTYDVAQGLRLYVNNVRTTMAFDSDAGPVDNMASLVLGHGYAGMLDEIALYDHALPQDRVQAHYHAAGR